MSQRSPWVAAHLHYTDITPSFLTEVVRPFIDEVFDKKYASRFFFIRYTERGKHLRLRFQLTNVALEDALKRFTVDYFTAYFASHPSSDLAYQQPPENILPNNTVHFAPYEPETERYGGEAGLEVATEHFQASSIAVLQTLTENTINTYNDLLPIAFQFYAGFIIGTEMSYEEAIQFFNRLQYHWLSFAGSSSNLDRKLREQEVLDQFKERYTKQAEQLNGFIRRMIHLFRSDDITDSWQSQWIKNIRRTTFQLNRLQEQERLSFPVFYNVDSSSGFDRLTQQRWAMYDSYLHMTHNRLGISNGDESYVAFLFKESLKQFMNANATT